MSVTKHPLFLESNTAQSIPVDRELVARLRASFALLAPRADELTALFYARLFAAQPGLRPLFPADMAAQRTKLAQTLAFVVASLEDSAKLRFYAAKKLVEQRGNLLDFITRSEKSAAAAEAHFRDRYDVSLRHLVPIAEPVNLSCAILIHLGKGERFGWCFRWDHTNPRELQGAQPSFEKALAALTSGIERRDPTVLRFLGIHTE